MKTEATTSINSTQNAIAMTLAHHTTTTESRSVASVNWKSISDPAIQDLLETSARDADGRRSLELDSPDYNAKHSPITAVPSSGGLLDWTG